MSSSSSSSSSSSLLRRGSSSSSSSRSSVVLCSEKYSCMSDRAEAVFECIECRSFQCSECERRLHSDIAKHRTHDRRTLPRPSPDRLCQPLSPPPLTSAQGQLTFAPGGQQQQQQACPDRNFADVLCDQCSLRLCHSCDRKIHSTPKNKTHRRTPITTNTTPITTTPNLNTPITTNPGTDNRKHFTSCGLNDSILTAKDEHDAAIKDSVFKPDHKGKIIPIKPLSPLSDNDDSLTFVSLPQQEDFESANLKNNWTTPSSSSSSVKTLGLKGENSQGLGYGETIASEAMIETKRDLHYKHAEIDQKFPRKTIPSLQELQLRPDLMKELKPEKEISVVQNPRKGYAHISDAAATLPLSCDYGKDDCDMADLIADSLQRSQLMDEHPVDDLDVRSFPLANQHEELLVKDEDDFVRQLACDKSCSAKVVSIFGNTGDGKSYTLNHTFFEGRDVFQTSPLQDSCTAGVWAAYDPLHGAIVMDTEGMLGVTSNHNQRMRLLLKILAISDIVIYRTRAERLSRDLFQFLGDASKAYLRHFSVELKSASRRLHLDKAVSTLGPSVIIFHETQHTEILAKGASEPAESLLRNKFEDLNLGLDAFSSLQYVGTRTRSPPTDFKSLLVAVKRQLNNNEVRCSRNPGVVFRTLKVLNEKFMDEIDKSMPNMFPDQYFTCRAECLSCNKQCILTMNHLRDGIPHETEREHQCKHQAQYDNTVYTCKACFKNGRTVQLVPKTSASTDGSWFGLASYAWSGYVLECSNCGVIYRSRQHWYGNAEPEKTVVRTEIRHVWPDTNTVLHGSHNAARRLLDGINYVSESIVGVGAKPTKFVSSWVTDKIAPPYWIPNAQIKECYGCKLKFDEKIKIHHCRACGRGFCDSCSTKRRLCPERGWDVEPVRVCDACFDRKESDKLVPNPETDPSGELMPRKMGEVIGSTVGAIASLVNYPLVAIRDAARPTYWMPDEEIKDCCVCRQPFGILLKVHHCRSCGKGVCDDCSPSPRPVPSRGWDHPVRVCKMCHGIEKDL